MGDITKIIKILSEQLIGKAANELGNKLDQLGETEEEKNLRIKALEEKRKNEEHRKEKNLEKNMWKVIIWTLIFIFILVSILKEARGVGLLVALFFWSFGYYAVIELCSLD